MKRYTSGLLAVVLLLAASVQVSAQRIVTVAGNGKEDYTGNKGPATAAALHWPQSVALDKKGRVYIADALNNCIRRIDEAGIITTIAGTGYLAGSGGGGYNGDTLMATATDLFHPGGVAVDTAGNVFFADVKNHCVRKIDKVGMIQLVAGKPEQPGFSGDMAAATAAKLDEPVRVAVDTFGNIFIADAQNNRIRKVDRFGIITTFAGNGGTGFNGDGGPASLATIMHPADVATDKDENVYIVDELNHCVRKVDKTGLISTIAGEGGIPAYTGDGLPAKFSRLYDPAGIALDDSGNIYISDRGNDCIRKISKWSGVIATVAGQADSSGFKGDGGSATAAKLDFPQGLAANSKGSIYIADQANNRIRFVASVTQAVNNISSKLATVDVFPNPSNGTFTINMDAVFNEEVTLTVINAAGQKVYGATMYTNKPKQVSIDAPGMYFISATTTHGSWVGKVVVQ